eukprot:3601349-Amphidinium_carterae.1
MGPCSKFFGFQAFLIQSFGFLPGSALMPRLEASGLSRMVSFSVLTQFAQMMTNLQRTTVFGDVNCQATSSVTNTALGHSQTT